MASKVAFAYAVLLSGLDADGFLEIAGAHSYRVKTFEDKNLTVFFFEYPVPSCFTEYAKKVRGFVDIQFVAQNDLRVFLPNEKNPCEK